MTLTAWLDSFAIIATLVLLAFGASALSAKAGTPISSSGARVAAFRVDAPLPSAPAALRRVQ
jgi:hypothetical protein